MERLASIWQIDKLMVPAIASRVKSNSYVKELERLLNLYRNSLHDFTIDGKNSLYDGAFKEPIYKTIRELKSFSKNYHIGNLLESNKYMRRFFKSTGNSRTIFYNFVKSDYPLDSILYRCRKNEFEKREDLFHTPFDLRSVIGTNRFSVPGYPCLYLGSSIECCIKEVANEKNRVSVSAFKSIKPIKVYDFRFFPPQGDKLENNVLYNQLLSYPFKIAASIPTITHNGNDVFKEEYIIPQMMLHGTIMQRYTPKADGIIFTSTNAIREGVDYKDYCKYENIVIPAKSIREKGYCKALCKQFSLTRPHVIAPFEALDYSKIEQQLSCSKFENINPNNE